MYNNGTLESDGDEDHENEFSMLNPDLLDYDEDVPDSAQIGPISPTTVDDILLPNEMYYEMCFQLNEKQRNLFNFIMTYAVNFRFAEDCNSTLDRPFYIF